MYSVAVAFSVRILDCLSPIVHCRRQTVYPPNVHVVWAILSKPHTSKVNGGFFIAVSMSESHIVVFTEYCL